MHAQLLRDQRLRQNYLCSWADGESLFQEGDVSQELHVLVQGVVEVLKGRQKISEISEPGTLFGEMSWLRDAPRSATLRALGPTQTLRLPRSEISPLLKEYPGMAEEIARQLAARLAQASEVLHGLKEFCDHLPDAVILADAQGRILAYNAAAALVYGRSSNQALGRQLEDVYQDRQAFEQVWQRVQGGDSLREQLLAVDHPQTGARLVSTSVTALRDAKGALEAVVFLGRDVTRHEKRRRLYARLLPTLVLALVMALASPWWLPWLGLGQPMRAELANPALSSRLAADLAQLSSLLGQGFQPKDSGADKERIAAFFQAQGGTPPLFQGVYLLDREKIVLAAQVREPGLRTPPAPGSTYANLSFQGAEDSSYRIVVLYRSNPAHPGGERSVELAYPVGGPQGPMGWLVLAMDLAQLRDQYGLDEQALWRLELPRSR